MNRRSGFRELIVWQRAMTLVEVIYRATNSFPSEERYGLTSQMRRAAVSIAANIAEGHGRSTRGEYVNQLSVARGSLKELETLSEIAHRLNLLAGDAWKAIAERCDEVSRMLTALKRALTR